MSKPVVVLLDDICRVIYTSIEGCEIKRRGVKEVTPSRLERGERRSRRSGLLVVAKSVSKLKCSHAKSDKCS